MRWPGEDTSMPRRAKAHLQHVDDHAGAGARPAAVRNWGSATCGSLRRISDGMAVRAPVTGRRWAIAELAIVPHTCHLQNRSARLVIERSPRSVLRHPAPDRRKHPMTHSPLRTRFRLPICCETVTDVTRCAIDPAKRRLHLRHPSPGIVGKRSPPSGLSKSRSSATGPTEHAGPLLRQQGAPWLLTGSCHPASRCRWRPSGVLERCWDEWQPNRPLTVDSSCPVPPSRTRRDGGPLAGQQSIISVHSLRFQGGA